MKGIQVVNTEKQLIGGCWYFEVGSDISNKMFILSPFKVLGKPYMEKYGSRKNDRYMAVKIITSMGNTSIIFLNESGLRYQINDHKLFRYSVSTYKFMSSMVDRQDLETYRKLFVPRHLWTEVDQYFVDFLDRMEEEDYSNYEQ